MLRYWRILEPYLGWLLVALGLYACVRWLLPFLLPFLVAGFLAAILDPPVAYLVRRGLPRTWAAFAVVGLGFVAAVTAAVAVLTYLLLELQGLYSALPQLAEALARSTRVLADWLWVTRQQLPPELAAALQYDTAWLSGLVRRVVEGIVASLHRFVVNDLGSALAVLVVTWLATFFISRDKQRVSVWLDQALPARVRPLARRVRARVLSSLLGYVKAQLALVLLTFLATLAVLVLMGAPYALSLAILTGFLDLLPVVGPGLVFVPWAVAEAAQGRTQVAFWLLVGYGLVSLVRAICQAAVVGGQLGLPPLAVLIAMYVGARLFGASGLIWGPLLLVILKSAAESGMLPLDTRTRR